jgi:predicted nucleotidyltransferase
MLGDPEGVKEGWPDIAKFVKDVAKEKNISIEDFLGKKVDLEKFDYRPKSDLDVLVDKKRSIVLPSYLREGKLTQEVFDLRVSLLDELVKLVMAGKLRGKGVDPRVVAERISIGMVTSLKEIGGVSRGEELDRKGPKAEPSEDTGKEPPAKEKSGDGKQGAAPRWRYLAEGSC